MAKNNLDFCTNTEVVWIRSLPLGDTIMITLSLLAAVLSQTGEPVDPHKWMMESQPRPVVFQVRKGTCIIHDEPGEPWFQMNRETTVRGRYVNRTHHVVYFEICRLQFDRTKSVSGWISSGGYSPVREGAETVLDQVTKRFRSQMLHIELTEEDRIAYAKNKFEEAAIELRFQKQKDDLQREYEEEIRWKGEPVYLDLIAMPIIGLAEEAFTQWVLNQNIVHPVRQWEDSTGSFSVTASYVGHTAKHVSLVTEEGREIQVELSQLSSQDQRWLRTYMKHLRAPAPNPARDLAVRQARARQSSARSVSRRKSRKESMKSFSKGLKETWKRHERITRMLQPPF